MNRSSTISRRQVLRGAAGFTLGLPFLPSLLPGRASAGTSASLRPRRFVAVCTEHGGVWSDNMFPSESGLTDAEVYGGRTIRRGDLAAAYEGEQARLSPVLSAPAAVLTPERLAKLNVIRGIDAPFYIGHHRGGHLGNYAANDGNGADGRAMWDVPRPTIDQVMAWSDHFYGDLSTTLERSMIVGNGISFGWSSPTTQSGNIQALPAEFSSLALFNRIFVPQEDELSPRPAVVDRVMENYRSLRQSNRRLSAADRQRLDEHLDRLDELQRRLSVQVSCGGVTPPADSLAEQEASGYAFDPEAQRRFWQSFNDVIATAFICDTSRIAVLRITDHFSDYPGDWHENIAHRAHLPDDPAQGVLAQAHQRVFADVFMDLVRKLDVDQGDGTSLLDDALVAWTQESGNLTHDSISVPIITAGSAGGDVRTGQYLDYRDLDNAFAPVANTNEIQHPGLSYNQWLGTALQAMGLPRESYEQGEHGGYGVTFVGEGREGSYPSSVLDVQGEWLPWLRQG